MNIRTAILEFIANEFHLDPQGITFDTSFVTDLNMTPDQLTDFLTRLQDSLNIILPEDKLTTITTVGNLLELTTDEDETDL